MGSQTALLVDNPADRRRSQRLLQFVPLVIRGGSAGTKTFWEDTFTVNVSAHGALIILAAKVGIGQNLVLMNPANWQEEDVRVARLGTFDGTRTQVAVEFMQGARDFGRRTPQRITQAITRYQHNRWSRLSCPFYADDHRMHPALCKPLPRHAR